MSSMHENHMKWVQKLIDRGETILQPEYGESMNIIKGFIKISPKAVGIIFQDEDGSFGLFGDFGTLNITGIDWNDLGLCDVRCGYEWADPDSYRPKLKKFCPCCNQEIKNEIKGTVGHV